MRKAVQFGAGNIGRGFLGQLLSESGYETVYIDVDQALIDELNRRREYPLRLVSSDDSVVTQIIKPVRAVSGRDIDAVARELADADLAGTSVGVKVLPHIAGALAAGINLRAKQHGPPLNVLLCENQWHAASLVKGLIDPHLDEVGAAWAVGNLGLVETVIGRMVPIPTAEIKAEDPLLVVAEPYKHLPIARAQIVGDAPDMVGVEVSDKFEAYEARKLFLHNAGHAALAYLGYPKHTYIWEAARDFGCREACLHALTESQSALVAEYKFDARALKDFAEDLVYRFENKALGDTVARVAADPLRKLRPDDRLIGAANLCIKHGICPNALVRVIASALRYDNPNDPVAVELQDRLEKQGRTRFLVEYCEIVEDSTLFQLIEGEFAR